MNSDKVNLHVLISNETRQKLKYLSFKEDKKMSAIVNDLITDRYNALCKEHNSQ
jgi:hypothetical protein